MLFRILAGLALAFSLFGGRAAASDDEALLNAAARSRYVLLGESTHGTHEYYLERARLTEALIAREDVRAIAIEGDWSGAARVNRYVRGEGTDTSAEQALSDFREFPTWMWRNAEFRDFVERLRAINLQRPPQTRVGVYGLDVYDMFDAADAVTAYVAKVDPAAGETVRGQYRCFARFKRSADRYSRAFQVGSRGCEREAKAAWSLVMALPRAAAEDAEARFAIERAASTVVAGEEFFRVQQTTGYSWNARDRRMADGARQVAAHTGGEVVIWAHNTHVGDARETSQHEHGELSLGQLLRQDGGAFLVGLMTGGGEVIAAEAWDEPPKVHALKPALPESHEAALAEGATGRVVRMLAGLPKAKRKLERAVGVVYAPNAERIGHYIEAHLERQFDAVVFFPVTAPVTPLPARRG